LTMLFANEIISLAFGKEFLESGKMLTILSLIIIFRFSMYTYTAILSSSNLNYIKLYTSLVCVGVNIGLNYILIPIYGVYGAIVATVITELLLIILFKYSSSKIIFINIISLQEILIILLGSSSLLFLLNYQLEIKHKIIILCLILISLYPVKRNLKNYLIIH